MPFGAQVGHISMHELNLTGTRPEPWGVWAIRGLSFSSDEILDRRQGAGLTQKSRARLSREPALGAI